ncbi:carboxymuconolactone decarboxylase family protein [Qipengyuania sp. GH25]|uniref:Carboxymuconolactone decarboxylase family protein n=1 Tax=Qipengyuania pacifica TaxID=2860199 RepID=A0ABS7JJ55_9SPHN|nr:carboxymuconolactone decarboxylase family protein [Qipengyuania aerophila]MBX7489561.1 carboxymuconolactone decarboxylase family protein [Qipengyuania aerophila]
MSHTTFKDWPAMAAGLIPAIKELHKSVPGVMKAFREMSGAAHEGGALDSKTKELLAVAISVAVRCDPCITYHVEGARKHGATREEIAETLGLAIYMGAGPSAMYAAQALEAYDQYTDQA